MKVQLTYSALRNMRTFRWPLYEVSGGNVIRVTSGITHDGHPSPGHIYELVPPCALATFLNDYPEGIEVISMADADLTNPNIITTPAPNATAFTIVVSTITTAGTPVQLPNIVVPDGRALVVVSDAGNATNKVVYVATSSANALSAATRATLSPGNSVKLYVTNANLVWVDSNANGQKVDVIVEQ